MFRELDDLKALTQVVAMEALDFSKEKDDADDADQGALVIDGEMDSRPYEKGNETTIVKVDGTADAGVAGSSGNITGKRKAKRPIFENDPEEEIDESTVESILAKGLGGLSVAKSLKKGLRESCCIDGDPDCEFQYHPGDCIKSRTNAFPVILIVKSSDGPVITAAKPTNNMDEYCEGSNGCWPEFQFNQDEIEPIEGIDLNKILQLMAFNDAQMESLTDSSVDETPMKDAADRTNGMMKDKRLYGAENCKEGEFCDYGDLKEMLDEICGPMKTYTYGTPKTTKVNDDGSVETKQSAGSISFGAW